MDDISKGAEARLKILKGAGRIQTEHKKIHPTFETDTCDVCYLIASLLTMAEIAAAREGNR